MSSPRRLPVVLLLLGGWACGSGSQPAATDGGATPDAPAATAEDVAPALASDGTRAESDLLQEPADATAPEVAGLDAAGDLGAAPIALPPEFPLAAVKAAKAELVARLGGHMEGPSWRDGELFFVRDGSGLLRMGADLKLYRYFPGLRAVGSFLLADGSLLVCNFGRTLVQISREGKMVQLANAGPVCNDLTVDAAGNIYFSDFATNGTIKRLTPDGQQTTVLGGLAQPNGIEVDPASKYLYIVQRAGQVLRAAITGTGLMGPPEKVAMVAGEPDGCAFDSWGNLWIAGFGSGQIAIYSPAAKQIIATVGAGGPGVTNLTFGGPDRDTVFATVDGLGIYRIPVKARGFAGHPGASYTSRGVVNMTPDNQPL
jgi:sugar lactone lactonase YvrE